MTRSTLSLFVGAALAFSACGPKSDAELEGDAERVEQKAAADLSKMEVTEIIDYLDTEAVAATALLETVTDGPSAEAIVDDIRVIIPRLNAALTSVGDLDPDKMKMNLGVMRKMIGMAKAQGALATEVVRISQIPEARDVLEAEFDKLEIGNQ